MTSKEWFRDYYMRNREHKLALSKAYQSTRKTEKKAYDVARRLELGDVIREYDRQRSYANRGSVRQMLARARARAKREGILFDLSVEDVIVPAICPALGIPLYSSAGSGGKDNSPSLDRIIPARGYVKGNVAVISNKANRMKNDGSLDELLKLCEWLKSQHEQEITDA